jgi:predicted kinase
MIIVLFGQPNSGKSTIANELISDHIGLINIDGDKMRELFSNKDYSREGRIKNLNRASDIAVFLDNLGDDVVLSLVYPYKESRDHLNSLCKDVKWIHLTYEGARGRENYHVSDFDVPGEDENVLNINTSKSSVTDCLHEIKKYAKLLS